MIITEGFAVIPILAVGTVSQLRINQTMLRLMVSGKYHFLEEDSMFDPYFGIGGGGIFPLKTTAALMAQPQPSVTCPAEKRISTNTRIFLEFSSLQA